MATTDSITASDLHNHATRHEQDAGYILTCTEFVKKAFQTDDEDEAATQALWDEWCELSATMLADDNLSDRGFELYALADGLVEVTCCH